MLEFKETIEKVNKLIKTLHGAKPIIEVCFISETITVKRASSSAVKTIANAPNICTHLTLDGLTIKFFKK